jgi:competence protein ComGC
MQHYVCACVMRTKLKRKSYTLMESLVSLFITSAINILSPQHNIVPNKKKNSQNFSLLVIQESRNDENKI